MFRVITYYFLLITSLLLISSLILLLIWWVFLRERIGYIIANPLMTKHRRIPMRIVGLWFLRSMIVLSLMGIIVGAGKSEVREVIEKKKQNILIVLDISRSMLAEDISPSRIEAAKQTIATFLTERWDDAFGLIVFAGKPFVSIPFSTDTAGISSVIANLNTYYIRQDLPWLSGTAIGDALLLANSTLSGHTDKSSIVLITDGRANIGIDPMIAAGESADKGIPIFTIAIGGTTNEILSYMDPYTSKRVTLLDESGAPLRSDIDETLLRSISETTGGAYYRVTGARELYDYWDRISARLGNTTEKVTQTIFVSYRSYLFLLLILLILIERIATTQIFYKKGR